ncbi:PPC domain-containing DNA-binding protein [uncultured Anaerococcus sp.]|uniref:PPC domain-containing DNA-binding protein n=1 Tax=uncultured Anaerococcus sp. TaxID=293428 RepID=UPI0025DC7806|nr:PPC domain-containing DNA-binding protein [uncultured Anaerococcus sp.]
MDYKRFDDKIVLRLKKGDKIIESLEKLANEENITGAHFQGIGAVNELKIGVLHPGKDDYEWDIYNEDLEITSLIGNITIFDQKPIVHTHITCAGEGSKVIGGHLGEATCSFTAEIFVDLIDGKLEKQADSELGINIIEF